MKPCVTLVVVLSCYLPCSAQNSKPTGAKPGVGKEVKAKAVDARALVEALASRNRPPKHVGEEHYPIFDPKFDWEEDARVWRAIKSATDHAEEVWPELVKHLNDERYCVTYESFSEYTYDFTVGRVCHDIILRNLAAGYFESVRPTSKVPNLRLGQPHFLFESQTLKKWCEARRGKKLYELQIELCKWAAAELAKPGAIGDVDEPTARKWIAVIEKDARSLSRSKTAVPWAGFGHIEFVPYSPGKVEAMRR